MWERLQQTEKRYDEVSDLMAKPEVASDPRQLQELGRELSRISDVVTKYREYREVVRRLDETNSMLKGERDEDMIALVRQEIAGLEARRDSLEQDLRNELLPHDANDDRDVIVEVRAGTGGEEAALFGGDLFRMYTRYAQLRGWNVDIIDVSESGNLGFREVIFEIKGKGAFSRLKYERGVHRVQRVPVTEASGRIHTSTATVAVLPEADDVDVNIRPEDLRIDIFHSSGAGGQNVNKLSTAVRITHLPTGTVAVCQDERSQLRNRQKAMAVLRARILDVETRKQEEQITQERRSQVGSGERAEKIRTYNFPQDRVTDHRIGVTLHNLPRIMEGDLDPLIDALAADEQAKKLALIA